MGTLERWTTLCIVVLVLVCLTLAGLHVRSRYVADWVEGERLKSASARERIELDSQAAEALGKLAAAIKQAQATVRPQAPRATQPAQTRGLPLPPNPRTAPQDRTSTFTIAAAGELAPIEVGLTHGVVTELRFQYPLKVVNATGLIVSSWGDGFETVSVTAAHHAALYRAEPTSATWATAGDAMITLNDGRTLEVNGIETPLAFDQVVNIQLPLTCISPSAPLLCEVERKQIAQLTADNANLTRAVQEAVQYQVLVEQLGQDAAFTDGFNGGASGRPRGFMVPEVPFTWQRLPPCDEELAEEAINGGCWIYTGRAPPCLRKNFEHGDRCFIPVAKNPAPPRQSEDSGRIKDQPAP